MIEAQACPFKVESLNKSFDNKRVLDDVSLKLNAGETFGLIGLNGTGKTTMIKIALDLLKADSGEAILFDVPSHKVEARKNIAYLPEKFQPSRYLKGKEYLSLSLSYYGKPYDHEQGRAMATALDLDPDALDRRVSSYSKGMGQKLGLAGALLSDTPLLILDEPMSGLDPKARILLKKQLNEAKKQGKTIFFSSHILADMDEICDRVAILHKAVFRFTGTPAEFKKAYPDKSLEEAFLALTDEKAAA